MSFSQVCSRVSEALLAARIGSMLMTHRSCMAGHGHVHALSIVLGVLD